MKALRICVLCFAAVGAVARAEQSNVSTLPSVAVEGASTNAAASVSFTIDGFTYENVRWGRITPSTATIFHRTGVATIPLEKLPPEWRKKLGYDPVKAQRYRQAEAQARAEWLAARQQRDELLQQQQAEKDRLKKLEASAVDFHCTIMALDKSGAVVRTTTTVPPVSAAPSATELGKDHPVPIQIIYAFLVGHPRQASLAVGDTISCRAYRDGVQETDGEPLPRWVYIGEARHPIPPPPPP
ncbi:MAG TPA: hypothetical protein VL171_04180 [Verrucomicrobiae bacterium]|nr:hypothetical protein [Verrucomicrobiae bacterium]